MTAEVAQTTHATEYITPSVLVDGVTVPLEGWMFVLACAIRGFDWAVKEALDPAFDMAGKVRDYERRRREHQWKVLIAESERSLAELHARLRELQGSNRPGEGTAR